MSVTLYREEPLERHTHWFPEARRQGQASARAGGAVTEEVAVTSGIGGAGIRRAGGEVGDVDLGVGEAGLAEGVAVRGPQVEEPAVGGPGVLADEARRGGAEGLGDSVVDVEADLVAGGRRGGAEAGDHV